MKSFLTVIKLRLKSLFRSGSNESEMDREMRFHLESAIEQNIENGMSPREARQNAAREFGSVERYKEDCRDSHRSYFVNSLIYDVKHCFKRYRQHKVYTAIIVLTIAICIGLNTSMFSLMNSLLFNPRLYPQDERVFRVYEELQTATSVTRREWGTSALYYLERKEQSKLIESIALQGITAANVSYGSNHDTVEYIHAARFTPSMFEVLRSRPAIGRAFVEADTEANSEPVAIISHEWWRSRYNERPDILEQSIFRDGRSYRIIGVMPEGFQIPLCSADLKYPQMNIIVPLSVGDWHRRPSNRLQVDWGCFVRLKPNVSPQELETELNVLNQHNGAQYPVQYAEEQRRGHRTHVVSLGEDLTRGMKDRLYVLQTAILFIFVLGTVNVASLVLGHNSRRTYELSIRQSLGGTRLRVIRQLLTEVSVLAVAGGILGIALAYLGLNVLQRIGVLDVFLVQPRLGVDLETLIVALGLSGLAALISGWGSAYFVLGKKVAGQSLRESGYRGTTSRQTKYYRGLLVFVQVVSTFILLAGGGLLLKSFSEILKIDPGFESRNVLTATIRLVRSQYTDDEYRAAMFRFEDELRALPGIESVGISNFPPMKMNSLAESYLIRETESTRDRYPVCGLNTANEGFFKALGISIIRGRMFDSADSMNQTNVVLIDSMVAETHFKNTNPIGQRIAVPRTWRGPVDLNSELEWFTIIGVVETIKTNDLYEAPIGTVYRNYAQSLPFWFGLVAKTHNEPRTVVSAVDKLVTQHFPKVAFGRVETIDEAIAIRYADRKGLWIMTMVIGSLALALSLLGLFGVVSYSIATQTKEFGIRLAIGADRQTLLFQAMGYWVKISLIGLMVGYVLTYLLTPQLNDILYNVGAHDVSIYLLISGFLAVVLTGVIYGSARSVTTLDPNIALRSE